MKIKNIVTVLLVAFILASCAPAAKVVSTETAIPTSTFTPVPTTTTITPTPIPTINVEGHSISDPRFTNPDFFDIGNTNSPIVQFANAFDVKPEDVMAGLNYYVEQGANGNNFAVAVSADGIVLLVAEKSASEEFTWQAATLGNYWGILGKHIGTSMNGDEWRFSNNKNIFVQYFSHGGILGLLGQVRPGADIEERRPSKASEYLRAAQQADMAFMFNNVVEPGKFPKGSTPENIDQWLDRRLTEISKVIIQNKSNQAVYIQFNEATNEKGGWNRDNNPLKDKYRDQWLGEYIFQALLIPIRNGLVPNKDYILLVNENSMFSEITQKFIHTKLKDARAFAYQKLVSDSSLNSQLNEMGITRAEDIQVVLGTETYVNLDNRPKNGINFVVNPTVEQINFLADFFSDTGGIFMTEVSPHGSDEQKEEFLLKIASTLKGNSNIHGILLWNIFNNPEDSKGNFMQSPTELFDSQGNPTHLYYALLRH